MNLLLAIAILGSGQVAPSRTTPAGQYKVVKTTKVGGDGGFDYVYANSVDRQLYIARGGSTFPIMGRLTN